MTFVHHLVCDLVVEAHRMSEKLISVAAAVVVAVVWDFVVAVVAVVWDFVVADPYFHQDHLPSFSYLIFTKIKKKSKMSHRSQKQKNAMEKNFTINCNNLIIIFSA